ncbi:MAG: GAF domain-containing protein, partial [Chloroflexi bacterium]|nr:GAF domain-containing protein [Chloroflexota bacterium]
MDLHILPVIYPLLLSAILALSLAHYALRRRTVNGALPLGLMFIALAFWSAASAFEMSAVTIAARVGWTKVAYPFITLTPVFWLVFTLQHTNHEEWLTPRRLALLLIVPSLTVLLTWTNELHQFMWVGARLISISKVGVLDLQRGWYFWVHIAYSYSAVVAGMLLLARAYFRQAEFYRKQTLVILLAALIPWISNILYVYHLTPWPHLDITPFSFTLSGAAASLSIFRLRLLNVLPIARTMIIESMTNCVMVLDEDLTLIDINLAANRLLGRAANDALGQPIKNIIEAQRGLTYDNRLGSLVEIFQAAQETDVAIQLEGETRHYHLQTTVLRDRRERPIGRLVVWSDVTQIKQSEAALRRQFEELRVLNAVALACAAVSNEDLLIERITHLVGEALFPDSFGFGLINPSDNVLIPHSSYQGITDEALQSPLQMGQGVAASVAASGQPLRLSDVSQEPRYLADYPNRRSELCVPLKVSECVLGVINAESAQENAFSENDEQLLLTIAGQVATAIDRLRSLAAERRRIEKMAALYQASQEIAASLDVQQVYSAIHSAAARIMPADGFVLALLSQDGKEIVIPYIVEENEMLPPMRLP